MNLKFHKLSSENRYLTNGFTCVETNDMLTGFKSKDKRRIRKHSKDMENFLIHEAYEDQEKGISCTYLFTNEDNELVAYISLCNDAIKLEFVERDQMKLPYTTEPALKIARLGVSTKHQRKGIGKSLLRFAVGIAEIIGEYSGVVFLTLDCYAHRLSYYQKMGFKENIIQPVALNYDSPVSMRLWLSKYLEEISLPVI